jgi:hypothetical protein
MSYYIQLPDGRYAEFSDDVDPELAQHQIYQARPDFFTPEESRFFEQQSVQGDTSAFGRGFMSALERTRGNIGAFSSYVTGGSFQEFQKDIVKTEAAASEESPYPTSFGDVQRDFNRGFWEGLGTLSAYAGELAGATLPYMVGTVVGGAGGAAAGGAAAGPPGATAGAIAGGAAGGFPQFFVDNVVRQVQEGAADEEDIDWLLAAGAATGQASLNAIGPVVSGVFGRAAQTAVLRQLLDRAAKVPMGRYAAAGVATSQVEGMTEVLQTALERAQAGLEPFEKGESLDSYIGGATLGALLGPLGAMGSRPQRPTDAAQAAAEALPGAPAREAAPGQPGEQLLALPPPAAPPRAPVFDMRPEADETPEQFAERAIRVAGADFPEGPYKVDYEDGNYRVTSEAGEPIGRAYASADAANEVAATFNQQAEQIELDRSAKDALRRTRQQETEALLQTAREAVTPIGTFSLEELGPDLAGRVNNWRVTRGQPVLETFTLEDIADAKVPRARIDKLIDLRRPMTSARNIEPNDVYEAARAKNIVTGDENFETFAYRTTGARDLDKMSQTQLQAMFSKLNELPENVEQITMPVAPRPQFSESQYRAAVDAIRLDGRYSLGTVKEATGLRSKDTLEALRQRMIDRGEIIRRGKGDYRLSDILGAERKPTTRDLPEGATRSHMVRELPLERIRIRKDGKSLGTFVSPSEARAEVSKIRRDETRTGAKPSEISMEPAGETGYAVLENRYDPEGNFLGQAPVASYRSRSDAEKDARKRDGLDPLEFADPKPAPPEALAGRMDQIVKGLEDLAKERKLPLLGARLRLVKDITTVNGEAVPARFRITPEGRRLIELATAHLTPDMTVTEIIEALGGFVDHELIHVLRQSGLLGPGTEAWNTLARYVHRAGQGGETYYDYAKRNYSGRPGYLTDDDIIEEAIAEAFRDWAADRRAVQGKPAGVFKRIAQWFKRLLARVPEDIFTAIETGALPEQAAANARKRAATSVVDETAKYAIDAPLGARVPPPENDGSFNIVHQRTDTAIGKFLKDLGRSKRRLPVIDSSIFDVRIKLQDKMLSVKEMMEIIKESGGKVSDFTDPYMQEQLYHGRVVERIRRRERNLYVPLLNAIKDKPSNTSMSDVEDFLYARHAPERNAELERAGSAMVAPSGMTDAEAETIMNRLKDEGKLPALQKIAEQVDAIIADTNETRIESGLISREIADASPYQHYVPLRGFSDEDLDPELPFEEAMRARSGRGFSIAGREDPKATGRQRKAGDILGHIFLQNEEAVIRAEKNRVARSFVDLVRENPNSGFGYELERIPTRSVRGADGRIRNVADMQYRQDEHTVIAKEDGKEVLVKVEDPRVARAIKMNYPSITSPAVQMLGKLNRYLATVNTSWNPEFLVSNFARDLQTAGILANQYDIEGLPTAVVRDTPNAIRGIREVLRNGTDKSVWAKAFNELQDQGGTTEFLGIRDLETKLADIRAGIEGGDGKLAGVKKNLKKFADFLDDYNRVIENGVRLAAYVDATRAGVSKPQAAFLAKNLTVNFNKGGEWKSVANSWYLFYNASLQGSMVLLNGLRNKKVQRITAGVAMAGLLQDMANRLMSDDSNNNGVPDYDEIPDYVLEHNFVVMDPLGLLDNLGMKQGYIAIPMPYGFNAFHNLGRNMSAMLSGSPRWTPQRAAQSIVMTAVDSFNPLGGASSLFNFVAPTVIDPLVDLTANRDFANRPIVPERPGFGVPTPQSQLFWNSTAYPFKFVAEQLNSLTGGNVIRRGMIDMSPEVLEYWFDYALGAAGAFVMRTGTPVVEAGVQAYRGEPIELFRDALGDIEIGQIPFIRRVVGNITERDNTQAYYENAERILTLDKELKHFRDTGNVPALRESLRENRRDLRLVSAFRNADSQLQKLRRQLKEIRDNPRIPGRIREQREDQLRDQMDRIMRTMNRLYFTTHSR